MLLFGVYVYYTLALILSVLAIPTTVTYFTMYEQLKVMVDDLRRSQVQTAASAPAPSWVSLTAGGLARWFAVTVVSPLELVRTKMQSQKMPWSQVRHPARYSCQPGQ